MTSISKNISLLKQNDFLVSRCVLTVSHLIQHAIREGGAVANGFHQRSHSGRDFRTGLAFAEHIEAVDQAKAR